MLYDIMLCYKKLKCDRLAAHRPSWTTVTLL